MHKLYARIMHYIKSTIELLQKYFMVKFIHISRVIVIKLEGGFILLIIAKTGKWWEMSVTKMLLFIRFFVSLVDM